MFDNDIYAKIIDSLKSLSKNDQAVMQALKATRKVAPDAAKTLARHIFQDSLVPRVGNAFAYKDREKKFGNTGVWVSGDANSFGSINKEYGFEKGNEAIKHLFNTAADVSRATGGRIHRIGGDEMRLHFPTPDRAMAFLKEVKNRYDKSEVIPGTKHRISASFGMGYTPQHAEQALIHAKDQLGPLVQGKRQKTNPPGQETTVFHSLLHETPPEGWRPSTYVHKPSTEQVDFGGLKPKNPL